MGRAVRKAQQQARIEGSPQDCFDAITDYESFPDWQGPVKMAEVLNRDKQGRGRDVEFEIDAKVKTIRYTLRYSYEEPERITWEYLEGDVKDVEGDYTFEDQGDGTTLATYTLHIDPGVWVPGPLAKQIDQQVMKRSVEDLKKRVESS